MPVDKKIVYTIETKVSFGAEDDIKIKDILDLMRDAGLPAEVIDVSVEDGQDEEEEDY